MRVSLVFATGSRQVDVCELEAPEGSTIASVLTASGWKERHALATTSGLSFGIWNHKAALQTRLRDQDRVEVYRPLLVDPKVARRERFRKQGARTSGLFATRRPGAKPGY
jgi:putative ubiquitin-RnfH superfamily antitoxin RatB of RatAB toxin-antitoxin module